MLQRREGGMEVCQMRRSPEKQLLGSGPGGEVAARTRKGSRHDAKACALR